MNHPNYPSNVEAECSLLGSFLLDSGTLNLVDLEPAQFYLERNSTIYQAMRDLDAEDKRIDVITLSDKLREHGALERIGGVAYLSGLMGYTPTAGLVQNYADLVRRAYVKRQVVHAAEQIAALGYDSDGCETSDIIPRALSTLTDINSGAEAHGVTAFEATSSLLPKVQAYLEGKREAWGIATGLDIDKATGGLQAGDVWIIAADPGIGKTALLLNILSHVTRQGNLSYLFSLEMTRDEVMTRLICERAGLDSMKLKRGQLSEIEKERLFDAMAQVQKLPLVLFTEAASTGTVRAEVAKAKRLRRDLKVVGIDYLALLSNKGENEIARIKDISLECKRIAKEFDVTMLLIHTLNRVPAQSDNPPQLHNLGWSRQTEYDASVVLFPWYSKERMDQGASIIIAKNRNGVANRQVPMVFDETLTRWANWSAQ